MSTKYILAEQVLMRLVGGFPDVADSIQREDLYPAIGQKVNAIIRAEHFSVTLKAGDTIPNNLMLGYYDGVSVTASGIRSKLILPVLPVSLPLNMGVYAIEDESGMANFIPLQAGQRILLKSQPLINDLLGQVGYELRGRDVMFTKDITLLGISGVNLTLVVFDIAQYSETDVLPITAEMEQQVIDDLMVAFSPVKPESGLVNSITTADNNTKK